MRKNGDKSGQSKRTLAIVLVITAVITAWLIATRPPIARAGLMGKVGEIDERHGAFSLEEARVINSNDLKFGEFNKIRIIWNAKTKFYKFESKQALEDNNLSPANVGDIAASKEIVVVPYQKAGNVVHAVEIILLP